MFHIMAETISSWPLRSSNCKDMPLRTDAYEKRKCYEWMENAAAHLGKAFCPAGDSHLVSKQWSP